MNRLKEKIYNKETINYLIFGVLTTLVNLVTYKTCTLIGFDYRTATVVAWILAVTFAYFTNKIYVFNSNSFDFKIIRSEFPAFIFSRILSGVFDLSFMIAAVEIFSVDDFLAKLLVNFFVVVLNYIASKYFVFKNKTRKEKSPVFLVSFLMPVVILIIIYIFRGIYPFGENCYLTSDMYHQYAPFYMEMYNKIMNMSSFFYSWHTGMGVNFIGLYAYYLSSPVNWLLFLSPEGNIVEAMSFLIIIKTGLSGLTTAYYLSQRFKTKHIAIAAFSLFYALSSYFSAFSWNIMWLDCLLLLPLILLGLERLVKNGDYKLYTITLGLSILSNYYISIMICIFSVFYFLMLIVADDQPKNLNYYIDRFKRFAIFSLLAGGLAAILLLPEYYAIQASASSSFNFPKSFTSYFSIFDMLSRGLMIVEPAVLSGRYPNIYSSVVVFLLLPFYWMNPKANFKEKTGKTILLIILLVGFNMNVFNFIWHGLHFPNSLPARQSFIFIFMVLTMSFEGFIGLKQLSKGQIFSVFSGTIIFFLMIEQFIAGDDYHFGIVYLNMTYLTFYLFLMLYYRKETYKPKLMIFLLLLVVMSESGINTAATGLGVTNRTVYVSDNQAITDILDDVSEQDTDFYRVEKEVRRTNNDSAWHHYKGFSTFSSTAFAGLNNHLNSLGFSSSTNSYSYDGYTPLTASLFAVKYMLHNQMADSNNLIRLIKNQDGIYLYENIYTLPIGFMLEYAFEQNWKTDSSNPFRVQNSFSEALINKSLFESIETKNAGKSVTLKVKNDRNIYVYISNSATLKNVSVNKSPTYDMEDNSPITFSNLRHKHIINIGKGIPDTDIIISAESEEITSLFLTAYSFNEEVFIDVYNHLSKNPFVVKEYGDTFIRGTIDSDIDGIMYTSIPFDNGWKAYVNGEQVTVRPFKNAFVSIPIPEGKHYVEYYYEPQGFISGLIITLASLVIFISLILIDRKKSKMLQ
ncbi:MAG: Uncharacterized protein XD91_1483 [Clostridiales bacterium 38_11]|nr:MAG: Uncharacterized protein XD91_1483 [Clostridiales bacterium 38_11]HBH11802.1 hypothetical protein [Clostridiales bacterium]